MAVDRGLDLDNPEFKCAWNLIKNTNQSLFLTGKAGTGKSTFLKYICRNTDKKYVVLAPTGIAAVNVGGVTLHSFFRLPFKPLLPDDAEFSERHLKERMKYSRSQLKLLKNLELIIIDEISMVRADIIDFIDKLLRVFSGNKREPFGGKQLLLIGDIFQLEPVVTSDMKDILSRYYTNNYFFSAHAFDEIKLVSIELKKVYRQNEPVFIEMLDRIRMGKPHKSDIEFLNAKSGSIVDKDKMTMTLATTRSTVDAINDERLRELPSPEEVCLGSITGDFPENSLPTLMELTLKVGAQIVFIKNDMTRRWVNGTIGRIVAIEDEFLRIEIETGEILTVSREIWSNIKYEYDEKTRKINEIVLGTFTQYPVKLAWALTIHKSQGLTFNDVVIDFGHGTFSGGQAYVALSRCRSLDGMSLVSTINERDVFVNPKVVAFSNSFNDQYQIDDAIKKARLKVGFKKIVSELDAGKFSEGFGAYLDLLKEDSSITELITPSIARFIKKKLNGGEKYRLEVEMLNEEIGENRRKFKKLASEYVAMGNECLSEGMEPTPVLANYDKAIEIFPDCVDAWIGKGKTFAGIGSVDDAETAFRTAEDILEKYPDATKSYNVALNLGNLYLKSGRLIDALDNFLKASDLNPESANVHTLIAKVYDESGDEENAEYHRELAKRKRRKRK